jgi:hypothetical protein
MLTDAEERELQSIVARGFWAPRTSSASGRFIPQPNDAARYHELTEKWVKKQMEKPND